MNFQCWLKDSHGLFDYEGSTAYINRQEVVESDMGSFFVVRKDGRIITVPPTSALNRYEDGDSTTVLFKVANIGGKYFIYHKDTLTDENFCDTSHMIHYHIKHFRRSTLGKLAGSQKNERKKPMGKCMYFPESQFTGRCTLPEGGMAGLERKRVTAKTQESFLSDDSDFFYDLDDRPNFYKLKLGDIVKFGKVSFKVVELNLPQESAKWKKRG